MRTHDAGAVVLAFACASLLSVGCTKLLGIDKDYVEGDGGVSHTGAGGATHSSSTGTGGHGGTPVIHCSAPTDCPGAENECAHRKCEAGVCGAEFTPSGTRLSAQKTGDCLSIVCDGHGLPLEVADDTDVPDDSNPCTRDLCDAGVPSHAPEVPGTSCGGTLKCDASGSCTGCAAPGDCPGADTECQTRSCTATVCGFVYALPGTQVSGQTPGDCKKNVCNGQGQVSTIADPADPEDDGNPCTIDGCSNGSPTHSNAAAGASCNTTGGGVVCNGTGSCVQCLVADTCPGQNDECKVRACNGGACSTSYTAPGTVVSLQASGDCKKNVCDGNGNVTTAADDGDLPDDGNPCTSDSCSGGKALFNPVPQGTGCGSGHQCDASGNCLGCLSPTDCPGADNECQSRACNNGVCGMSYVPAGTPVAAQTGGDCKINVCDGSGNTVTTPDDGDVPNDGDPCTTDICSNGSPSHGSAPAGTACGTGGVCNGAGTCGVCVPGDWRDCCGIKTTACCNMAVVGPHSPRLACCCGGTQDCDASGVWGTCY